MIISIASTASLAQMIPTQSAVSKIKKTKLMQKERIRDLLHLYEPMVFWQVHPEPQLWVPVVHSLMSAAYNISSNRALVLLSCMHSLYDKDCL